jgi:hypothetical protein
MTYLLFLGQQMFPTFPSTIAWGKTTNETTKRVITRTVDQLAAKSPRQLDRIRLMMFGLEEEEVL